MEGPDELWFLIGCTASGKSAVALEVADALGAEIVSMDSMLVYVGMDVGTAKPSPAERARVVHHALDLVTPDETFTVQRFHAAAERALADVRARGRRALFVGGTALYLKTLLHGMFAGPDVDRALRASLERRFELEGAPALHEELARVDPAAAARVHAHDRKRVVRALEVWQQTGRPLSEWQREWGRAPARAHRIVGLELETAELDRRIARRTSAMLGAGWVEEARRVRAGTGFGATASQALGYAEALALGDGELGRDEAEQRISLRTRQFARRQRTWFRKFADVRWTPSPSTREDLAGCSREVLEAFAR